MSDVREYEVVVVGGGPAGSACATFLSQRGHSVLLLDKELETKFKVGESLLPALWEYWLELGVTERLEKAGFPIKAGVYFRLAENSEFLLRADEYPQYFIKPWTYHVDRLTYDRILLENAREKGVTLELGANVKEVLFEGERATGVAYETPAGERRTVRCQVVVDATGRATLLAGKLGRRYPNPRLKKVAFYTHFRKAARRINEDGSTATDIHATDGGWIWCIPLREDVTSVGTVFDGAWVKESGKTPEQLYETAVRGDKQISEWLAGAEQVMDLHRIPSISYLSDDFVGDGFLMIGDASLFIDPIFSAGVTIAMRGADFAARAISEGLKKGDTSAGAFRDYEAKIRVPIMKITRMIENWYEIMKRKDRGNVFEWSRSQPILRERLIVLFSGGYDKVDLDAINNWS
jgi:FAD-dependent halogenase